MKGRENVGRRCGEGRELGSEKFKSSGFRVSMEEILPFHGFVFSELVQKRVDPLGAAHLHRGRNRIPFPR